MTQPLWKRWFVGPFLIVPAILLSSAKLQAETSRYDDSKSTASSKEIPVEKSCETPKPLEIRIGIPGWTSQLQGDFGVKGVVAPLDVTFSEILSNLDAFPIALSAELRYGQRAQARPRVSFRWGLVWLPGAQPDARFNCGGSVRKLHAVAQRRITRPRLTRLCRSRSRSRARQGNQR